MLHLNFPPLRLIVTYVTIQNRGSGMEYTRIWKCRKKMRFMAVLPGYMICSWMRFPMRNGLFICPACWTGKGYRRDRWWTCGQVAGAGARVVVAVADLGHAVGVGHLAHRDAADGDYLVGLVAGTGDQAGLLIHGDAGELTVLILCAIISTVLFLIKRDNAC